MLILVDVLLDEISPTLLTLRITVEVLFVSKFTSGEALCLDSKILDVRMNQNVHKADQ